MSEAIPAYIPCASGTNAFADVQVFRRGGLVHLVGHAHMEFSPDDAKKLAASIIDLVDEIKEKL